MRALAGALVALGVAGVSHAGDTCSPVECLRRISLVTPVQRVYAPQSEVMGIWAMGEAKADLEGRVLYLFPDQTYASTEWADSLPETIFDIGRWQLALIRHSQAAEARACSSPW
jgi:hypothetical protein